MGGGAMGDQSYLKDPDVIPRQPMALEEYDGLPLYARDSCAARLVPLNSCRRGTLYLPWKCEDERHAYEQCLYADYLERVKIMKDIQRVRKAEKKAASSG